MLQTRHWEAAIRPLMSFLYTPKRWAKAHGRVWSVTEERVRVELLRQLYLKAGVLGLIGTTPSDSGTDTTGKMALTPDLDLALRIARTRQWHLCPLCGRVFPPRRKTKACSPCRRRLQTRRRVQWALAHAPTMLDVSGYFRLPEPLCLERGQVAHERDGWFVAALTVRPTAWAPYAQLCTPAEFMEALVIRASRNVKGKGVLEPRKRISGWLPVAPTPGVFLGFYRIAKLANKALKAQRFSAVTEFQRRFLRACHENKTVQVACGTEVVFLGRCAECLPAGVDGEVFKVRILDGLHRGIEGYAPRGWLHSVAPSTAVGK